MKNSVIMLEFNELCPSLMAEFIGAGELPNFSRLYNESLVYVSDAEAKPPALEPWIQWITVHTGLTHEQHGIQDLGDGHKLAAPRVWDLLRRKGLSSWVCGSMNTSFEKPFEALFLPDPWSMGVRPFPEDEFAPYYNFVSRNVQEYTRDRVPLSRAEYAAFVRFMVTHGLSVSTASETASQLLRESAKRQTRWQRATILDRLQWDVFAWYQKHYDPDFSTFFLNSTAHFQHVYWRNMKPELFEVKPTAEEQTEYRDSILTGYRNMDEIVGKCLRLFGGSTIILASALSQQPCLVYEKRGGKKFYRVTESERLFEFIGMPVNRRLSPVMSEQFHIYCASPAEAETTAAALAAVELDGEPAIFARSEGDEVFGGCNRFDDVSKTAMLSFRGATRPFYDLFYRVDGTKSGMHHPDGIFWIRTPEKRHLVIEGKLPLRDVAPTILSMFGVEKTSGMAGEPVPELMPARV